MLGQDWEMAPGTRRLPRKRENQSSDPQHPRKAEQVQQLLGTLALGKLRQNILKTSRLSRLANQRALSSPEKPSLRKYTVQKYTNSNLGVSTWVFKCTHTSVCIYLYPYTCEMNMNYTHTLHIHML